MALAGLLCDMDGTLIDSEPMWRDVEAQVMAQWGATWTPALGERMTGRPLRVAARMMLGAAGICGDEGAVVDRLLTRMRRAYDTRGVPWVAGARRLLRGCAAAGAACAIVSSSYRVLVDPVWRDAPPGAVSVTVAGDEVEAAKPDPQPYLLAARRAGVDIARCVVVEDSPTGLAAAVASGAVPVVVGAHSGIDPAQPFYRASALADLDAGVLARLVGRPRPACETRLPA